MTTAADLRRVRDAIRASMGAVIVAPADKKQVVPGEVDTDAILEVLQRDDRGKPFDPTLARTDTGYFTRNRDLAIDFARRVDTAKASLAEAAKREQLHQDVAAATSVRDARETAEARARAAAEATAAAREKARWAPR